MSNYEFSCPSCGQKMSGDASYAGKVIACPACNQTMTVPMRPADSGSSAPATAGATPAPASRPASGSKPAGSPPPRPLPSFSPSAGKPTAKSGASTLAVVALVGSVVAVPGIICGHLALAPHREATSKEKKLALTGLLVSYCVLLVGVFAFASHLLNRPKLVMRDTVGGQPVDEARIVDGVKFLDQASEREHQFKSQGAGGGVWENRPFRVTRKTDEGFFSYVLKVLPNGPMVLNCTYWGSDTGQREFEIVIDGSTIARQKLDYNSPGHFFDMEYAIPRSLTRGKSEVTVEFRAAKGMSAGEVFGCQTLRK
jgi:DNA-directed RNA polymerase subunit RPC12/RpoP